MKEVCKCFIKRMYNVYIVHFLCRFVISLWFFCVFLQYSDAKIVNGLGAFCTIDYERKENSNFNSNILTPNIAILSLDPPAFYTFTVILNGPGVVISDDLNENINGSFQENTKRVLIAIPAMHKSFKYWEFVSGGTGVITDNPITVNVNSNIVLKAVFSSGWDGVTYQIIYDGNGQTSGVSPSMLNLNYYLSFIVSDGGDLKKTGYELIRWEGFRGKIYNIGALGNATHTIHHLKAVWGACSSPPPSVSTIDVTNVLFTSVKTGGEIIQTGCSSTIERGVCWGVTNNPTVNGSKIVNGDGTGAFESNITGLSSNITYYVRAFAKSINGDVVYGDVQQFTTKSNIQIINLPEINDVTYGDDPFVIFATSSSNLPVSLLSLDPNILSLSGDSLKVNNAGECRIKAVQSGTIDGYLSADTILIVQVKKADVKVVADDRIRKYGVVDIPFTVTLTGFVNGDILSDIDTVPSAICNALQKSLPGEYLIKPLVGTDENYQFELINGTLKITKPLLTVSVESRTKIYGESNPNFLVSYSGFISGDSKNSLSREPVAVCSTDEFSNVGTAPVTFKGGDDEIYDFIYINNSLIIKKRDLLVIPKNTSKIYGSENISFVFNYVGLVNNDVSTDIDTPPIASHNTTKLSNVGIYNISYTGGVDNNYNLLMQGGSANLVINKKDLIIKAEDKYRRYGELNPQLSVKYNGFVNNENLNNLDFTTSMACEATLFTKPGRVPIVLTVGSDNNYDIIPQNGLLTIDKGKVFVNIKDTSKVYGDENPQFIYSVTGLVNNETTTVFDSLPSAYSSVSKFSNVGEYDINISQINAEDYEVIIVPGNLSIKKASLNVKISNDTIVYGQDIPIFNYNITGFLQFDDKLSVDIKLGCDTLVDIKAGIVPIIVKNWKSENYKIIYNKSELLIKKAPLIVKVKDTVKVYGSDNPKFTLEFQGFLNNDNSIEKNPTIIEGINNLSDVGVYPISLKNGLSDNYNLMFVDGVLQVNKANLTVIAEDVGVLYNEPIPELNLYYDGFLNGNSEIDIDIKPIIAIVNDDSTSIGVRDIIVYGGNDNNYDFSYEFGSLIIKKLPQNITFPMINNQEIQTELKATSTSGLPIKYILSDSSIAIINDTVIRFLRNGNIKVSATQQGNDIYEPALDIDQNISLNYDDEYFNYINIYPNPAVDFLYVNVPNNGFKYTLIDHVGRAVDAGEFLHLYQFGDYKIDVSSYNRGIYLLSVESLNTRPVYLKSFVIILW